VSYVDGFVMPIPRKNLAKHRKLARKAGKIWLEHGALAYHECTLDDPSSHIGFPFPKLLKLKPTETAVFGWSVFRNKKHRDQVNKKVLVDKRLQDIEMTFDFGKMSYGGFKVLVGL
jgi:uncharacterized protein YbaA (DUF1428 family)